MARRIARESIIRRSLVALAVLAGLSNASCGGQVSAVAEGREGSPTETTYAGQAGGASGPSCTLEYAIDDQSACAALTTMCATEGGTLARCPGIDSPAACDYPRPGRPEGLVASSPLDGRPLVPRFTWTAVANATHYDLRVTLAPTNGGSEAVYSIRRPADAVCTDGSRCTVRPDRPLALGSYTFTVTSLRALPGHLPDECAGRASDPHSFTVLLGGIAGVFP